MGVATELQTKIRCGGLRLMSVAYGHLSLGTFGQWFGQGRRVNKVALSLRDRKRDRVRRGQSAGSAAARPRQLDPDCLSFTGCFRVLKCRLPECQHHTPQSFTHWFTALIWELQQEQIPVRRNRINPRVIKRKMSKWPKKRAKHKSPSRLAKRFTDTIVMAN